MKITASASKKAYVLSLRLVELTVALFLFSLVLKYL